MLIYWFHILLRFPSLPYFRHYKHTLVLLYLLKVQRNRTFTSKNTIRKLGSNRSRRQDDDKRHIHAKSKYTWYNDTILSSVVTWAMVMMMKTYKAKRKKNAWKLYTFLQKFEKNLTNADLRGKTREKSNKKLKFQEFFPSLLACANGEGWTRSKTMVKQLIKHLITKKIEKK